MNSKSEKSKRGKTPGASTSKKQAPKPKQTFEEETDDDELKDEWEKPTADEFDPDFEEFDMPKPKSKSGKNRRSGIAGDEFDPDEDYRDMGFFNDTIYDDDDDDDLY